MAFSDLVTLRGGFTLPIAVVLRMLDLEGRGASFSLTDNGRFRVTPPTVLTAEDVRFLRTHRDLVRRAIAYTDQHTEVPL